MSTPTTANLCSRLGAALDPRATGSVLADALVREWGADAAIVWLPPIGAASGLPEDELFLSGDFGAAALAGDLLKDMKEHRIVQRFADRGLLGSFVADVGPEAGRMAIAWRNVNAAPPQASAALTFLAAHISLLRDRQQSEERLAVATAALLEADDQIWRTRRVRALGEMASGVVHDFNNALTSILGFTELALGPLAQGDAFFKDLSGIRMAALDAASLVRRLQSFGRNRREHDEREIANLQDVVRVMPSLVRPRWTQLTQVLGLTFDIVVDAQPVPAVHIVVAEIRELLLNLLFNAIDAMPSGGRITLATAPTPDGGAMVTVTDEGTGMSDEVSRQMFQPFFSTKGDRGSGLGLSVCRTIANRHHAQLDVRTAPGEGTTFTLRLPAASAEVVAAGARQPPAAYTRARPAAAAAQRVLLVDDQEEVRASVGEMLRALGHEVAVVDCGEAALALANHQQIDVVITDLGMPEMNGLALAQRFLVVAPRLPIILLTGWELESDAVRPGNVVFVLGKPVTMKALGDALGACVAEPIGNWNKKCS